MWEKNKGTIECDKSTITYDVGTAQFEDGTIKYEKKNKGITECDKSTITYDVSVIQREDGTIKFDILVTWYSRLPIIGYRTQKKRWSIVELPSLEIYLCFFDVSNGSISSFTKLLTILI